MLKFFKKLFGISKSQIYNDGEAITVSDKLEFERRLRHHNKNSIDDDLKSIFHLILDKVFRKMEPELLDSFLTKIKLKYHKNQELERGDDGDLYLVKNPYTNIYRERRLDNIEIEHLAITPHKNLIPGKMVYLDMIFTSLVETNKRNIAGSERLKTYKTPIRVYIIVDDDFISNETDDGEWLHKSVGFLRFGIILPEFSSLNLQTKTIPNTTLKLPYLYSIQSQRISSSSIRHFEIFLKRFKNDKELSKYMKEDDSTEGLYSEKVEEFINLFKLIHQAKSTIFRIKDDEKFCDWTSCEKL